jgi:hypothetical protein
MSILFSENLARATVYPVPHKTTAISYNYTPDRLTIAAHLKDKWTMINQKISSDVRLLDNFFSNNCYYCEHSWYENANTYGRCESVENNGVTPDTICPRGLNLPNQTITHKFSVAPTIFEIDLNIANSDKLFKHIGKARAWLRGTKVENNEIYLTDYVDTPPNVYKDSTYHVCWGNNTQPESLKGIVNVFFSSDFKNETVMNSLSSFKRYSSELRKEIAADNFGCSSRNKYLTQTADALLLIHSGSQLSAYFQMIASGFKPIPECSSIIMIPLVFVEIEHEGETYRGFKTPSDACNKKWFVSPSGEIVGQL